MHTRAFRIVALLRALVRLVPITFCIPPQRLQGRAQTGGRLLFRDRILETAQIQFFRQRESRSADDSRAGGRLVAC